MRGQKVQRDAAATLDELVRQGAVVSYATNLATRRRTEPVCVTVVAEDSGLITRERLWLRVRQALEPLGKTITIEIEFRPAGNARRPGEQP